MSVSSESGGDPIDAASSLEPNIDRAEPRITAGPRVEFTMPWDSIEFPKGGFWVSFSGEKNGVGVVGDTSRLEKAYSVRVPSASAPLTHSEGTAIGSNVVVVTADPTEFTPEEDIDVVTFYHAITAIPDWFSAIDNAWNFLKPGGTIGVVDYYVSRHRPASGYARHGWPTRTFWPLWFEGRSRYLSADHLPYLHDLFERWSLREDRVHVPFFPGEGIPRYTFVGKKREDA